MPYQPKDHHIFVSCLMCCYFIDLMCEIMRGVSESGWVCAHTPAASDYCL